MSTKCHILKRYSIIFHEYLENNCSALQSLCYEGNDQLAFIQSPNYCPLMIHPALATCDAIILNIYMYSCQKMFTLEFSKSILMRPQGNNQSIKMCVN